MKGKKVDWAIDITVIAVGLATITVSITAIGFSSMNEGRRNLNE